MVLTTVYRFQNSSIQQPSHAAIVFIHGFTGDPRETWGDFPKLLASDPRLSGWDFFGFGYSTRLLPDIVGLWSADAEPVDLARLLYTTIMQHAELARYKSISLIAHSMGGLVLQRALLSYPDLRSRLSHVVLFGTPSAGLAKASLFSFWKRQVRDMVEGSSFIQQLRHDWKSTIGDAPSFQFLTISGELDQFVPPTSSLAPFSEGFRRTVPGDHVSMIKPADESALCVHVVLSQLLPSVPIGGPAMAMRVAVESRAFQAAIDQWWEHRDELDDQAAVQLALALESVGRRQDAIDLLEHHDRRGTDALGVLAGRLKRRWLVERRRADAERALALYRQGYEEAVKKRDVDQAYYHGINWAFMELAYGQDTHESQKIAQQVLQQCQQAQAPSQKKWRLATEGEAHLHLGDVDQAVDSYRGAVHEQLTPRELESAYQQALRVADLVGLDEPIIDRIRKVFSDNSLLPSR